VGVVLHSDDGDGDGDRYDDGDDGDDVMIVVVIIVMILMTMMMVVMTKALILSSYESAKMREETFGHEGDDRNRRHQNIR
jgi:hypothetical protein